MATMCARQRVAQESRKFSDARYKMGYRTMAKLHAKSYHTSVARIMRKGYRNLVARIMLSHLGCTNHAKMLKVTTIQKSGSNRQRVTLWCLLSSPSNSLTV